MKLQSKKNRRINKREDKIKGKNNSFFKNIINGFGLSIGFSLGIILLLIVAYAGWHPASQIISGVFKGNYTFAGNVRFDKNVTVHNVSIVPLGKNKVVYLYPSMTAEQIQKIIDEQPKYIPYGKNLTFQFTNGVYNLNNTLIFAGFYGGGFLNIQGNTTEPNATTLHATQKVFLNFSKYDINGIGLRNSVITNVKNLKIEIKTNTSWLTAIGNTFGILRIFYSYIEGNSINYGYGVVSGGNSFIVVVKTFFSNINRGLSAVDGGQITSESNENYSIPPRIAFVAFDGGIIHISTLQPQPEGSQYNESVWSGGLIIKTGKIWY